MPRNALYIGAMRPLMVDNFSGGWNPRDAPSEVANNESPDCINVVLDERGGVVGRLGLARIGSGSGLGAAPRNFFFSNALGVSLVQDGAALKKTADFVTYTTITTFSTSARCAMCDFNNQVVLVHPDDKVFTYDGTTCAPVPTASPRGSCIAVWQNKVWVSGDPSAPARVYACGQGNPLTWNMTDDYNDLREADGLPVVALGAGQGMDISGRAGLLAFKNHSVLRINDSRSGSTFGQYTTLSTKAGAAGPLAVAGSHMGPIGFIGEDGIWATDGVNVPQQVSPKLSPLFTPLELNYAKKDLWCAGVYKDRLLFSMTRGASQLTNNFTLDWSPAAGWITPQSFGIGGFAEIQNRIFGASPSAGKIFEVYRGGNDDGLPIQSRFSTRWFTPSALYKNRYRRARVEGRGTFDLYSRLDYGLDQGKRDQFDVGGDASIWGHFTWGHGTWGASAIEDTADFFSLGVGHAIQFVLRTEYSASAFGPKLLEDGSAAEVGPFALYSLMLDYVRLGYS